MRATRRARAGRDKGIAMIMTALMLIPLMAFAAFGVDLASWYSRISYLQKAADAAALAGTVWMPNLAKSTAEANASLATNGIIDGVDNMEVEIRRGSKSTSLFVSVTDTDARRFFSQVMFKEDQVLTRSAEAEYNLPIPLGSPLNYFGGDATTTDTGAGTTEYSVVWPTDYGSRAPSNLGCNVGSSASQGLGRWTTGGSYQSGQQYTSGTENRACTWEPVTSVVSSPPANATVFAPTNVPCNRQQSPTSQMGRWNTGSPPTYTSTNRHTSGTGNRQCTWRVVDVASLPANYSTSSPPANRPCNVPTIGRWPSSGGFEANQAHNSGTGNRICVWAAETSSTFIPPPPNPIESDRSPGFWALINGPGQLAANGEPFSARCLSNYNCNGAPNAEYKPLDDPDRGFWYVVEIPAGGGGQVAINVFDAAINYQSPRFLDWSELSTFGADFETEFRVFKQNNPLDFAARSPLQDAAGAGNANPADGRCHWQLRNQSAFSGTWAPLCTFNATAGERYLVNVRTNTVGGTNEAGSNLYAIEAVLNEDRRHPNSPSIFATDSMAMYNLNPAGSAGEFHLAKVPPEYAGRTLVVGVYDAGDSVQNSLVYPMRPQAWSAGLEKVPDTDCTWTSSPAPNPAIPPATDSGGTRETSSDRIRSGPNLESTPQPPDSPDAFCGVRTSIGSQRQFNGVWLEIRVDIPMDYECNPALSRPEIEPNSCWWAIRYEFSGGTASDATTWRAAVL